ncbi:MAG TPA: acyl carrier protein [Geobacteraceae bacterium]|nr:acyl carrier protein [Geobacteraceae bacterium]
MDTMEILNGIFREVFDDESLVIKRETNADDIDDWDSLSHLNLVIAVEMKFGIKFALGELQALKNVGDMADLIEKKSKK